MDEAEVLFAAKLSVLIRHARVQHTSGLSYQHIAAQIRQASGTTMTGAYIQRLATGTRVNPKIHAVTALADYFGVPATTLLPHAETDHSTTGFRAPCTTSRDIQQRHDSVQITHLARLLGELSPKARRRIGDLVEFLYGLEHRRNPTVTRIVGDE